MRIRIQCLVVGATILLGIPLLLSADDMVTMENAIDPGPNRSDEPFIKTFSFSAAVRFMDETALTWQKQRKCFACHSGYVFLVARPAVRLKFPPDFLVDSL